MDKDVQMEALQTLAGLLTEERELLEKLKDVRQKMTTTRATVQTGVVVPLTSREAEVLVLVRERKTNKEISFQLDISESTVKLHVSNILRKMVVRSRIDLY